MVTFVDIVATGARTPLGMVAASSAAALRAGISGMSEHPFMVDHLGDPMPGAFDVFLDPDLMGSGRLLALAENALREACSPLYDALKPRLRIPIYLGLPNIRPGFTEQDAEDVRSGFTLFKELPVEISEVNTFTSGHVAGLLALATATEQIQRGAIEVCVIGGVDSYFEPETLEWLEHNRQLAGADTRSAFVPGEGAGFCLLIADRARERIGLNAMARVHSVSIGKETKLIKTSDVCHGIGLTDTIRSAVSSLKGPPTEIINDIICDINGERYRGEEWGFVCLRMSQYFEDASAYRSPADNWGDMGAASGPLFAMLACEAALNGYAKGSRTMLWASSEGGQRSAAVLKFENVENIRKEFMGHV